MTSFTEKSRRAALAAALGLILSCGTNHHASVDGTVDHELPPADGLDLPEFNCDDATDGDGDTIADQHEGTSDTDGDTLPNREDTDSDGDGYTDAQEAGDGDICTAPANHDDDSIPDYIDADSDNDGLSDAEETRYSTDPYDPDSDDDEHSDLAEVVTGHDPNSAADTIPSDDFYMILPFEDDPQERTLEFRSNLRKADVYFVMDTTGSMTEEASNLASGLRAMLPQLQAAIPDVGIGSGYFEDFPVNCTPCTNPFPAIPVCYGTPANVPYFNAQNITTNIDTAQTGVDVLRSHAGVGGCNWASSIEALYQIATGAGINPFVTPQACPLIPDDTCHRIGYPCFRCGALPIVVVLTDTASRQGPGTSGPNTDDGYFDVDFPAERPHTYEATLNELLNIGARVFGVISGAEAGDPDLQFRQWATDTGTVNADGTPIIFPISGDGTMVTSSIVDAIEAIAGGTPQDVDAVAEDQIPDDPTQYYSEVNATEFIVSIVATECTLEDGSPAVCEISADGTTFLGVPPGYRVRFTVTFRNTTVHEIGSAQVYRATITVRGNHVASLDEREVIIIIPASSVVIFG